MSKLLKAFASSLAIAWATGAAAQTSSSTGVASAGEANTLEEVLVTAQRRTERLVDVPISVATATPDDLERAGPSSIENLTKLTPGVYFQRAVYGLSPTVRGIGSTLSAASGEQNVALYIDEVYRPTPTANIFDLASVAGVEVLKGPQGTLFGRNATGGAILIRTLDPSFDTEGRIKASYERFNTARVSAYFNAPVTDTLAGNLAVSYRHSDGYVRDLKTDDVTNEGEDFNIRGKLLVQPSDDVSVVLTAAYYDFDDPTGVDTKNLRPALALFALGGAPIATDRWHSSTNTKQYMRTSGEEFAAHAKLNAGEGSLNSITAFQRNRLDTRNEIDLTYVTSLIDIEVDTETFSQEINYTSAQDRPLTYVAGVYYFNNKTTIPTFTSQVLSPVRTPLYNTESRVDAFAGYVDGAYAMGDLSFVFGLRYSYERRRAKSAFGVAAPSPFTRFQEATDKQWTPRVGLRYALASDTNVYATYSRGFKSGVFDGTTPNGPGVKPEKVDAFEVGLKSASPTFTYNAAAFYYDYKDTQANAALQIGNAIQNQLVNVPKARIYGLEADVAWRINDHFDVRAAAAYTHSRYVSFKNAPGWADLGLPVFVNIPVDASGKKMVRAPELTLSSTVSYRTPVGGDKELVVSVSPYYSSRVYFTFDNTLSQAPYLTLDAAATLNIGDDLELSIYGRNLTDKAYKIYASQLTFSLEGARYATPRTYGVSLNYAF